MVDEDRLSGVLAEFARTVITDFPIQRIVDHLVDRIVSVLPITSAGVTLISADKKPHYIAASDEEAMRFERLQSKLGEGPCLTAYETAEAVAIPDLTKDDRFPKFAPAALEAGLAAVFTFPLRHNDIPLGALDLYRTTPGALDSQAMAAAQTLADVATAYLLNAQAREDAIATSDAFHHSSLHDSLTGLPNRQLLEERLLHAAKRAKRSRRHAALLFVDLDRFKDVNDQYGHHVGDSLLLAVTDRLSHLVRTGDTLARVSGDEFVILCEDISSPHDAEVLAERIGVSLRAPFAILNHSVAISASVGISFAGPGEDITDQLVITADMAMYQVKRRGGAGHHIVGIRDSFEPVTDDRLEADLHRALAANELNVVYQPIVRTCDRTIIGVEALVRWTHASLGRITPPAIVALAERTELIDELGAWVLRRACDDYHGWTEAHPNIELDLSVNVSVRQLLQPEFPARVAEALSLSDTSASSLVLEITESILIEDKQQISGVLDQLDELGVRVALDDFGTGFSSLSYLAHLPIHILKIDRSLIADLADEAGGIIVASVNKLAHDLGRQVVAEGVETEAQHEAVASLGCELAQGFLYSRPVSAAAIGELISDQSASGQTRQPDSFRSWLAATLNR